MNDKNQKPNFIFTEKPNLQTKYLKAGIYGESGTGKSYSGLLICQCLKESILKDGGDAKLFVITPEKNRVQSYTDIAEIDGLYELNNDTPSDYLRAINDAAKRNVNILFIDNISNAWEALKLQVDNLKNSKYSRNPIQAWADPSIKPVYNKLKNFITAAQFHVVISMLGKDTLQGQKNEDGKTDYIPVGIQPIEGKDMKKEFEFWVKMEGEGIATIERDSVFREPGGRTVQITRDFGFSIYDRLKTPFQRSYRTKEEILKNSKKSAEPKNNKPEEDEGTKESLPDLIKIANEIVFESIEQSEKEIAKFKEEHAHHPQCFSALSILKEKLKALEPKKAVEG